MLHLIPQMKHPDALRITPKTLKFLIPHFKTGFVGAIKCPISINGL